MNNPRRKVLADLAGTLRDIESQIAAVRDEEQDFFDNIPESKQDGERAQAVEEAIDQMDTAMTFIEDAISCLDEARN